MADTLIIWTDATGIDMALSFAEVVGCSEIWYVNSYVISSKKSLMSYQDLYQSTHDETSESKGGKVDRHGYWEQQNGNAENARGTNYGSSRMGTLKTR